MLSLLEELKCFWGKSLPPNFQTRPLKRTNFSDYASKGPQKRPYISAHTQQFQKSPRSFSVLRLDWRIGRRKDVSSWYPQCPNYVAENSAKMAKNGTFLDFLI